MRKAGEIPDPNQESPRPPDPPQPSAPPRPWGIDEVVVASFAFLGVGGAVVLQLMSKTIAPVIVSFLLATGLAALTYRFLGGIQGATVTVGAVKLTGAIAALVGIAMLINQQLFSQLKPPSQFQLWKVSGFLTDEQGKPVEPIDIKDFALDPPSFHHPSDGKFTLTIYSSPGLAGMEFPTLKINPHGFEGRSIDLDPNTAHDKDLEIKTSGNMITITQIKLHPPPQPYQPPQRVLQPVPFAQEASAPPEVKQ